MYTHIRHPQPYQLTLPSFNELLTSIPLPNDFTQFPKGVIPPTVGVHHDQMASGVSARGTQAAVASGGTHHPPVPILHAHPSPNGTLTSHLIRNETVAQIPPERHGPLVAPGGSSQPGGTLDFATPYVYTTVVDKFNIPTPPLSTDSFKESHMRDKRKHTCKVCLRSFTTSGHLARHNRIHTGERKHFCPWPSCDARFARQDNCMQHYKTHKNGKKRTKKF